ncbi:MAG: FKBP-type peptidyl-prolyl cis-trans isomerase [Bacteroidetes bacterium]|nr:FKBP-type peptidyl-prolyl cis-trans isomerase [Bacteroidota bacterium]
MFDESFEREPLEFVVGGGTVIPGFDNGVIGMSLGERKTIFIPAADAYGHRSNDLIIEFQKENIPDDLKLEIGDIMQLQLAPGQVVNVEVIEIKENSVVFDANHKLADKDLTFEVELVSIE